MKQVAAKTVHDLNNKRISQLTKEEYMQVREDWDVHFSDLDFGEGMFKVVIPGTGVERFHDKADAIRCFYRTDRACTLMCRNKILMTREH